MRRNPVIRTLYMITAAAVLWIYIFVPRGHGTALYCVSLLLIAMLSTILDSTNPAIRRVVWAIGLVVLYGAGPFLIDVDGGAAVFVLGGVVWLSISIFDFLLLRRTFAEISGSPPSRGTEAVAQYG